MIITPVNANTREGDAALVDLLNRFRESGSECSRIVTEVLADVKQRGDAALLDYTRKFDAPDFQENQLRVTREEIDRAYSQVDDGFRETLALAIERLQFFHEQELEKSWTLTRDDGAITGRLVRPVAAAGLYVPGGQGGIRL